MSKQTMVKDVGEVGPTMRRLREEKNLSQAWVAKEMGIGADALSRIENGHTIPGLETILAFCRVMNLTMIWQNGKGK